MKDQNIHGIIYSDPPQTPCGLFTYGRKVSSDFLRVTCKNCKRKMIKTKRSPKEKHEQKV